ncbi:MAG TPA: UPF0175 family protein [Roseiflexaceae bacterium]|jgi:predicted HTH domain antitoxin|nr:UPF0175 family protein [Roseiflexaceae bacterium]
MTIVTLRLEEELTALLQQPDQPLQQTAREFIILELYRRGALSSGKAAQLLHMPRFEFIQYASRLGIAFFDLAEDEWEAERNQIETL